MKIFIIIIGALCILFIVLAILFSKKKQPGLTPPKVHTQSCNVHDTMLCETTTECENTCKNSTDSKCYHLYYENYIWPFFLPASAGTETIAQEQPPSARIFKMFNEPSSFNNLNYVLFNELVVAPSKRIPSSSPSIFGYPTYIGSTIGTTKATFPELVQGFSQPMNVSLTPSARKSQKLPVINLPPKSSFSNLVPKIDKIKNDLPTCMHTDKVCAYWQYYTEPFAGYTLCGGEGTGSPDSPSCQQSDFYYGNYYEFGNLINIAPSTLKPKPNTLSTMSPEQVACYSNTNCKGYLETPNKQYVYVGIPNFSSVQYNTYASPSRTESDICLPQWSPTYLSPTTQQIVMQPPKYCPQTLSPTQKESFVLNPNHLDKYTFTLISPSTISAPTTNLTKTQVETQCVYKVDTTLQISSPTSYHALPKTCLPSDIDITTITNATNLQKKTCNVYDSIDMQKLSPYFSPTIPLNQRMYNAEQLCNNNSSCIWRDIMTGSNWELVDNIIVPPSTCTPTTCTQLDKLSFVYNKLFPTERLIYQTMDNRTSTSPTQKTITREFCIEDDKNSNVCETLLGITPVSPSSIRADKKYSYKIINFGCADMISDINNKVGTTIKNPDNNYLYYNHLLCDYKKQCYLDYSKKIAPTKSNTVYNNITASKEFNCNPPANSPSEQFLNTAIENCNQTYVDKIESINNEIQQVQSEIPLWKQTPYNRKTGVCLPPPNTFMSDNPCNLYTARSIVTKGPFDSNPVCNALGHENCNDDMFCYKDGSGKSCQCKGYCETSPTINGKGITEAEKRIKCEQAGTCMYVHNSPTPCQSMKNNWQCECLNNPYIQNLFEESNNRCDKLQPTRNIPNVVYYEDTVNPDNKKLYMQYSDNCCHFNDKNSPTAPPPSSLNKNDIFPSSEIPERFREKCETNMCSMGDRLFGQLVVPDCGLIAPRDCEPNKQKPNSVDQTWPCELRPVAAGAPTKVCANKSQYKPGNSWETDCYQISGDGEKQFTYDTCWNPLYGVLSPCGIDYPNDAYNGDLDNYFNKKCILNSCCDQEYPVTPIAIADRILNKPIN